eukprot:4041238-Ditylum_brightwellii.AAC.1
MQSTTWIDYKTTTTTATSTQHNIQYNACYNSLLGNGHCNGITATATSCASFVLCVSGGANGEVCIWDLASQSELGRIPGAHSQMVMG